MFITVVPHINFLHTLHNMKKLINIKSFKIHNKKIQSQSPARISKTTLKKKKNGPKNEGVKGGSENSEWTELAEEAERKRGNGAMGEDE